MENGNFEIWLPNDNFDNNAENYIRETLNNFNLNSEDELNRIVNSFINAGFNYYAARCLEIYAQNKIGIFFDKNEIINYRYSNFGEFHESVNKLIKAGCLYIKSKRENIARVSFNRALTFVEEALRQIEDYDEDNFRETLSLALAFEIAGHCCLPTGNLNALDYYNAAEDYFEKTIEINSDEFKNWKNYKVSKAIMSSLIEIFKIKLIKNMPEISWNYKLRLEEARKLINYSYEN